MGGHGNDEPCASCGRTTRAGSPLYSDRQATRASDAKALYLCGDCNARAIDHFGRQPTGDEVRRIATRAAGFMG